MGILYLSISLSLCFFSRQKVSPRLRIQEGSIFAKDVQRIRQNSLSGTSLPTHRAVVLYFCRCLHSWCNCLRTGDQLLLPATWRSWKRQRGQVTQTAKSSQGIWAHAGRQQGKRENRELGMSGAGHWDQANASMKLSAWVKYGWWWMTVWESHCNITLIQEISSYGTIVNWTEVLGTSDWQFPSGPGVGSWELARPSSEGNTLGKAQLGMGL